MEVALVVGSALAAGLEEGAARKRGPGVLAHAMVKLMPSPIQIVKWASMLWTISGQSEVDRDIGGPYVSENL